MKEHVVRVWDLPTRVAHWTLAALVAGAIVAAKIGGNAMVWHGRFGLAILGVVVFRIVWGVVGSTHARFVNFLPTPRAIADYVAGRWRGLGHNPLGALSVLALLALVALQSTAGLFANDDIAFYGPLARVVSGEFGAFATGLHQRAEWIVYAMVALHVGAVLFHLHAKNDDLIVPMITGTKTVGDRTLRSARGGGPLAFWFALAVAVATVSMASGLLTAPVPATPPAAVPAW
jgi:cytochrome b